MAVSCQLCDKKFHKSCTNNKHKKKITGKEKTWICNSCKIPAIALERQHDTAVSIAVVPQPQARPRELVAPNVVTIQRRAPADREQMAVLNVDGVHAILDRPTKESSLAELLLSEAGDDAVLNLTEDDASVILSPGISPQPSVPEQPVDVLQLPARGGPPAAPQGGPEAVLQGGPDAAPQVQVGSEAVLQLQVRGEPPAALQGGPDAVLQHQVRGGPPAAPKGGPDAALQVQGRPDAVLQPQVRGDPPAAPQGGQGPPRRAQGGLPLPLLPTPVKLPVKQKETFTIEDDDVFEDEIYTTFGGETCTTCKVKCKTVKDLQEHILAKHCTQSSEVLELMKMQQQLLNTILANQAMQERRVNSIALQQINVMNVVKELEKVGVEKRMESNHAEPALSQSPPAPHEIPAPPVSYADITRINQPPQATLNTSWKKMAFITDSIGGKVQIDALEKITKTKIKRVKAYASTRRSKADGFKFPEKNFTEVVPAAVADKNVEVVFTNAPSVELTNLPENAHYEYANQEASCSSYNMIKVAENAISTNSNLKLFVIAERAPRYDELNELNIFANEELHEALNTVKNENVKIHMKGSSGPIALTRSIASILAGAGMCSSVDAEQLCRSTGEQGTSPPGNSPPGNSPPGISPPGISPPGEFQVQRGRRASRGRGAVPMREAQSFQLQTQNQFAVLGN